MIKPFIFTSKQDKSNELLKALENIGLERKEAISSEKQETWLLSCPWKEEAVNLVWEKSYWEDGETLEDSSVSIIISGSLKICINLKELIGKKHTKPISDIVIERIENELKEYTGKA